MAKRLAALVCATALALTGCSAMNQKDQVCTVTGKETVYETVDGTSTRHYRVYTENCGTLEVRSSVSTAKFNSADVYGGIEVGKMYNFHTGGYRNGALSMFPNILDYEETTK